MECGCRDAKECRLREYAAQFEAAPERFVGEKRPYHRDASHPEILYEAHKCIQCGACVRLTDEVLGTAAMGFVGRGFTAQVSPALGCPLEEVDGQGLAEIVSHCPVGALTDKDAPVVTLPPVFRRP
jgi:NADH dehydrogenase/NADH:ubiquinone oxidoreductase subunit G